MDQLSEPSKPSELKVHGGAPQRVGASDHEEERKAAGGGDEPDDDANAEKRDDDADANAALLERSAKVKQSQNEKRSAGIRPTPAAGRAPRRRSPPQSAVSLLLLG